MSNIPIFLSSDNNFASFVATTIASICDNTKSFCEFYIIDGGISKENQEGICKLKKLFNNFSIEFIKIDVEKYFKDFPETKTITKSMYSRFLIPYLKPEINKAIYSDVDVIVLGDIREMYDEDLDGYALGAVWEDFNENKKNIRRKTYMELSNKHKYFSSGNLLLDCQKWRNENILDKLSEITLKYSKKLECPDQDVLNKYFDNRYKLLSRKYCVATGCKCDNTIIRHYNGSIKPWHIAPELKEDERISFMNDKNLFWKYAKMTKFYDKLLDKVKYMSVEDIRPILVTELIRNRKKTTNDE